MSHEIDKTTEDKIYLHIGSRLPLSTTKWTIQIDYNNVHMKTHEIQLKLNLRDHAFST